MNYHIFCNTRSLPHNCSDAIHEYTKRLSAYCNTELHCTEYLNDLIRIYKTRQPVFWIQPGISTYSSEDFSNMIDTLQQQGNSTVHILIGYKPDLLTQLYTIPDIDQSLQYMSMTGFQLSDSTVALLLVEQLYRAYTILHGKTYHK